MDDTIDLVERVIAEGGEDLARYLHDLHAELRQLRSVKTDLRRALRERDELLSQVEAYERFHRKLVEMIDEFRERECELARARLF